MSRPLVLVIDDDIDLREVMAAVLDDSGYSTVTCSNGREALEWLNNNPSPDLILVDLMMPVMNGRDFLKERAKNGASTVPTLVMSASANLKAEFGDGGYLQKPFDVEVMRRTLAKALGKDY